VSNEVELHLFKFFNRHGLSFYILRLQRLPQ
jgi:hypothetical protein